MKLFGTRRYSPLQGLGLAQLHGFCQQACEEVTSTRQVNKCYMRAMRGTPLPLTLGTTVITITDSKGTVSSAPLYYVSPNQASFLIPSGVAAGAATVKVTRSGTTVLTGSITVASASPGLYAENGNGTGVAPLWPSAYRCPAQSRR